MENSVGLKSPTVRLHTGLPVAASARTSAPIARLSEPANSCAIVDTRAGVGGALSAPGRDSAAVDRGAALRAESSMPASFTESSRLSGGWRYLKSNGIRFQIDHRPLWSRRGVRRRRRAIDEAATLVLGVG